MTQSLTPEAVLLAVAALVVATAVVLLFARSPAVGISALAAAQAWQVVSRGHVPVLSVGISLYPLDLLTLCAALAAVVSLVRHPVKPHLGHGLLALLGLLVAASLVTGMATYGVQAAGNEARTYFLHVLGVVSYTAVVQPASSLDRLIVRVWMALSCVYCVTAVFWWTRVGIGSNSNYVLIDGQLVNSRPVDAASAFVIAQTAVMLLCNAWRMRGRRLIVGLLLPVVVLLQHRTVWIAGMLMLAGWLVFRPGHAARKATGITLAVLLAVTALFAAALSSGAELTRNLASSATNQDTLEWRVDSSRLLIRDLHGVGDWLFGLPFGSGFNRILYGLLVDVQPHDFYLHLLLRVGLVGLCAAVALVLAMLFRADPRTPMGLNLWLTMAGLATFCLTYAIPFEQSLLIGLLLRGGVRRPAVRRIAPAKEAAEEPAPRAVAAL
jgi:hypothetical protein